MIAKRYKTFYGKMCEGVSENRPLCNVAWGNFITTCNFYETKISKYKKKKQNKILLVWLNSRSTFCRDFCVCALFLLLCWKLNSLEVLKSSYHIALRNLLAAFNKKANNAKIINYVSCAHSGNWKNIYIAFGEPIKWLYFRNSAHTKKV